MALLGGADEIIVGGVETLGHRLEFGGHLVGQLLCRDAARFGGLHHLLTVIIDAGEEMHLVAVVALEARNNVGGDQLIGMADMRRAIGIRNGRRDVEIFQRRSVSNRRHELVNLEMRNALMRFDVARRVSRRRFPTSRKC